VSAASFLLKPARALSRHLRRALLANLQYTPVTDSERQRLHAAGINAEPLLRYAAWRRSVLIVAVVPTLLAAMLATIDAFQTDREALSDIGRALGIAGVLVIWILPLAACLALGCWSSLRRSHAIVLGGWFAAFLPPFLIALVPLGWWLTLDGSPDELADRKRELAVLDFLNGLDVTFALLPTALAVLPGLVRA